MPDNSNYQFRAVPVDLLSYVTKKQKSAKYYFRYLLDRTMMMFEYKNLPETIPQVILERYLQINGVACITKAKDGNLYCFNGSWGGEQDVYYRPTKFIISNPHISQQTDGTGKQFTKECTIYGTQPHDAVLIRNDSEWASLTPLIARYAVLMCENCITVRSATIMLRCLALISSSSDKGYKSALAYLSKLEAGELGVVSDSAFSEGIKLQSPPSNNGSYLTQFIELEQYLKGSFFNELGLRANYNMKREAIGEGESSLDADSILPLCDNMLKCRREDICELNNLFNLDISVDFSSAWLENRLESTISLVSQLSDAGVGSSNVPSDGASWGNNGAVMTPDGEDSKEVGDEENGQTDKNTDGSSGGSDTGSEQGNEQAAEGNEGDAKNVETVEPTDGDQTGEEVSDEEVNEVKEELENNELTAVEGLIEVVNDKVSELIADARKGDLDE